MSSLFRHKFGFVVIYKKENSKIINLCGMISFTETFIVFIF